MSASYPSSTKAFSTKVPGQTIASADMNSVQDEIVALENGLLTGLAHHMKFVDASFDIGQSGATRPRNLYLSGDATVGAALTVAGATTLTGGITGALAVTGAITAPGIPVLLHASSGTDTTVAAAIMDSVAITGLTALDTLVVEVSVAAVTQVVSGAITLYNSTDSVVITNLTNAGAGLTAGTYLQQTAKIRQAQNAATNIYAYAVGLDPGVVKVGSGTTFGNATFVTAWTGAWTLALRHGGVVAGGTCQYSWTVFKYPGQ